MSGNLPCIRLFWLFDYSAYEKDCEGCGRSLGDGMHVVFDGSAEQTYWHLACLQALPARIDALLKDLAASARKEAGDWLLHADQAAKGRVP